MKKTMTRIMLLAAAMVLALSLCFVANAEEATETAGTPAYIFWQDSDWWPAAWLEADDYWTPTPAMVTGEGWYTVKLDAHMPSWFYSGGNSNIGAQKLAVIIKDGHDLFPGLYMQIVDIRVDGVSYPCGAVTYGQTGYDNINNDEGGKVYWDANDTYGLIWDQWMIDNGGTVEGVTWDSTATAQKFDVFDVSVLNNPSSIEIDFFLSAQQDVRPEGGPELRVLSEGPAVHGEVVELSDLAVVPENATNARMFWLADNWWVGTSGSNYAASTDVTIIGEGEYSTNVYFPDQGGWSFAGQGSNALKLGLVIDGAFSSEGSIMNGMYVGISDLRINGESIPVEGAGFGQTYFDDEGLFAADDGVVFLYHQWVTEKGDDYKTWDGSAADAQPVDGTTLGAIYSMELDFFVTDTQGQLPEPPVLSYDYQWYPNNTMGVAGISLRDKGITNKWYNVCPVNLTVNGIYKIPLVASNMFVIGDAIVTVQDGNVTVDYETQWASPGNMTISNECVKWFASLEDVTDEFCQNPQSDIAFGDTVSTADLGNTGYLFICNRVTYCQPIQDNGVYLPSYFHNNQNWKDYRAALEAMVAEIGE